MDKTIIEALKNEPLDVYLSCGWRQMFWRNNRWRIYEECQVTGENNWILSTQDEKEAIEALVSES